MSFVTSPLIFFISSKAFSSSLSFVLNSVLPVSEAALASCISLILSSRAEIPAWHSVSFFLVSKSSSVLAFTFESALPASFLLASYSSNFARRSLSNSSLKSFASFAAFKRLSAFAFFSLSSFVSFSTVSSVDSISVFNSSILWLVWLSLSIETFLSVCVSCSNSVRSDSSCLLSSISFSRVSVFVIISWWLLRRFRYSSSRSLISFSSCSLRPAESPISRLASVIL